MDPKPLDPLDAHRKANALNLHDDTPEGRASMIEIQKRVLAATHTPKPPAVDHWTGKKLCHRFFHFVQTEAPSALNPRQIEVRSNLVNVGCLGSKCSMWDDENKRCHDVTASVAHGEISKSLDVIDGLLRMLHDGGQ